ncbi:maleylpyruvate isomerase N-terminal domain-containing protein [Streptomyces sp. L7]
MDYLVALRRELDAFGAVLDGDLSAPVEHCGGWRLVDLAAHMGAGNLWVVAAVRERHGRSYDEDAAPRDRVRSQRLGTPRRRMCSCRHCRLIPLPRHGRSPCPTRSGSGAGAAARRR